VNRIARISTHKICSIILFSVLQPNITPEMMSLIGHKSASALLQQLLLLSLILLIPPSQPYEVTFAMNAGGDSHVDTNGVQYEEDNNTNDYRLHWVRTIRVFKAASHDSIIYRTMHMRRTMRYDIPINENGKYWLILMFIEIDEKASKKRVFDVFMNGKHKVLANFDIFAKAGRQTAHDEFIHFSVCNGTLRYKNEQSEIKDGRVRLHFSSDKHDTTVNGILLVRGHLWEMERFPRADEDALAEFKEYDESYECKV
jgi:Malectin domain